MSSEEIVLQGEGIVSENEFSDQEEELQQEQSDQKVEALLLKKRKRLTKQLSMCGTPGDMAWERRRRQTQRKRRNSIHDCNDEDLNELRGCIELGFGFNEEDGQKLCNTLPALDLYFAVNRNLSPSPVSTPMPAVPHGVAHSRSSSSIASPTGSIVDSDSWKICNPGDDPALIKTKLRHWAQAVACSVMQSHS